VVRFLIGIKNGTTLGIEEKAMETALNHEYLCPHCGTVNALSHFEIRNMYTPQYADCHHCKTKLEIVPADGIGNNINLVVSEAAGEVLTR